MDMCMRKYLWLILSISIISACGSDDQSSEEEFVNLPFTANNLEGDWNQVGKFQGFPNDSLGNLGPEEDVFRELQYCQKDDMIRYDKGVLGEKSIYYWGIGENACHSQIANSFLKMGNWDVMKSGKLTHSYTNGIKSFVILRLDDRHLFIREELAIEGPTGLVYEFTNFERRN